MEKKMKMSGQDDRLREKPRMKREEPKKGFWLSMKGVSWS